MMPDDDPSLSVMVERWGLAPTDIRLLKQGANTHWRVRSHRDTFVVRQYGTPDRDAIDYELGVLRFLRGRNWPVPEPLADVQWSHGAAYVLFTWLPGQPRPQNGVLEQRERGAILARLHRDLATYRDVGQRPGWLRADQIAHRAATAFERLLGSAPETFNALAAAAHNCYSRLRGIDGVQCPTLVVHGDLIAHNLLFERDVLTGLLDFDSTHLDFRAADVACARRGRHDDVVRGYLDSGATLTSEELEHLDDFWRAAVLRYALHLSQAERDLPRTTRELAWCRRQLERTRRFLR